MAIYSNGTLVVDAANVQAPRLTGTLPALNASSLTNLDAADLSGTLPALNASALTNLDATDLSGALPALDGSSLTGVTGSTTFHAVGTYCNAFYGSTSSLSPGSTTSGGNIGTINASEHGFRTNYTSVNTTLSGTWRLMGQQPVNKKSSSEYDRPNALWCRTA